MLIAAIARPTQPPSEPPPFHIATLDVTAFVRVTPGR